MTDSLISISAEMLKQMDEALARLLPPELSRFVYEVESCYLGDSLLIAFMPDRMPTDEELDFFLHAVSDCIDEHIPLGEEIPTWTASVKVGARRHHNLAIGGTRVLTFEGGTKNYPLDKYLYFCG